MSPLLIRRREFTKGLAFGLAMAVSLPMVAQAAPIATQAPAKRPPRARDLLPPTRRPTDARCVKCGVLLGTILVDESERYPNLACGDCWRRLVNENEDLESEQEFGIDDARDETNKHLQKAQDELEVAYADLNHMLHAHGEIETALWAIADQLPRDSRGYERARDALDLLQRVGAKVTVPA